MAESDAETIQREWFEDPTFSYLKRHYFDAAKLEQRTMVEFARALRTGRVIAFTGSLTTIDGGILPRIASILPLVTWTSSRRPMPGPMC
jgi:hypothetical protein